MVNRRLGLAEEKETDFVEQKDSYTTTLTHYQNSAEEILKEAWNESNGNPKDFESKWLTRARNEGVTISAEQLETFTILKVKQENVLNLAMNQSKGNEEIFNQLIQKYNDKNPNETIGKEQQDIFVKKNTSTFKNLRDTDPYIKPFKEFPLKEQTEISKLTKQSLESVDQKYIRGKQYKTLLDEKQTELEKRAFRDATKNILWIRYQFLLQKKTRNPAKRLEEWAASHGIPKSIVTTVTQKPPK